MTADVPGLIDEQITTNGANQINGAKLNVVLKDVAQAGTAIINVNNINTKAEAYEDAATARDAVPESMRKAGAKITYLLAAGWMEDQFNGADISGWGTASNWKTTGPVSVSQNTLTAGGTYLGEMSTTYDVTLHSGQTFASLSALLSDANLNTLIPLAVRKGGMNIKFVQSSDNNYIQYRFKLSSFNNNQFTNVINWEQVVESADSIVSKELAVSADQQSVIRWQDGFNTGTHLGDTVVVKVNSNTAVLNNDGNYLRLQYKVNGVTSSTAINESSPYILIDGNLIGSSTTGLIDIYDLKVFVDGDTVITAGTVVVEVLTGQKAKNYYYNKTDIDNSAKIADNTNGINKNTEDLKELSYKVSSTLITHINESYNIYGTISRTTGAGCTEKLKLSDIKGVENGIKVLKGCFGNNTATRPSAVFFRENGTSVAGTYIGLVNEGESIPASSIPADAVYAGFNTYLPYSPDGLLIDGFGIPAEIKTIDDKVIDLTDEINTSNQTSENYIHLVSGGISTSTGADTEDSNRCRVSEFIELDSVGEFYYLNLFIGNDRYSGTRIFYDANKEVTTQENAVFERAYFNIPLPSDMYNVSVVGTTGLLKYKEFNVGKYYHVLNQHNSVDIINDSRVDIALGKLESDGSYADEMAASPIVNDEGNAYVGFRTETKASKRDYQSLRIVAINHDDAPESDVIGNRKIYNKYGFNASFNYILMPFGNTDTKFKKVKNVKQMLAEGHDLGLHAIMNSSYWITNFMFDVTPNSSTLFAPTIVDLQGDEADHTGTNAFGRSVSLSTNMNNVGFADLPSELASLKVVELDNQTWLSVIRKYSLYCDDSVISGLDLNDNIVSKTRLGWLEYWYNELIDSSLGYSSNSDDIATKFAADYTGTYPTKSQIINGNITGVGHFTKGLFKDCASCCNYEVMDRCIEVAKAFVLHYYGSCNFKSFHTHGVQYFRYGYISSENNCVYCDSGKQVLLNNRQRLFFSRTRRLKSLNDVLVSYGMRTTAHYENVGAACLLEGQKDLYFGYADSKPAFFSDGGLNADYLNFFGSNPASGGLSYANFNTFLEGLDNWLKFAFENAGESVTRNGLTYTVFAFLKNTILRVIECEGTGKIPVLSFDTIRFDPAASTAIDLLLKWLYKNNYKVVTLEEARSIASSHNREYKANYFPNPTFKQSLLADFEGSSTSEDAYIPDGWNHSRGTLNNMSVQVETVDGVNSNVFAFESDGSLNILSTKIYGLTAGKYKLSFYAKGSGSTAQVFKVLNGDFIDGSRTPILNITTSSAWQKYEVEFTIDEPIRKLTNDAISIICDGYQDNVAYIQVMLRTGNTDNISISRPAIEII